MASQVLLNISDNGGYSPDQINTSFTLGRLLEEVEQAIEVYGADSVIVLNNGQRYGATYGSIIDSEFGDLFYSPEEEEN
ncbi:hypothetical protein ACWIDW_04965 [Microbacterium sp. NPDC055312]